MRRFVIPHIPIDLGQLAQLGLLLRVNLSRLNRRCR
jgi:hypothetical protein